MRDPIRGRRGNAAGAGQYGAVLATGRSSGPISASCCWGAGLVTGLLGKKSQHQNTKRPRAVSGPRPSPRLAAALSRHHNGPFLLTCMGFFVLGGTDLGRSAHNLVPSMAYERRD